MFQPFLVFTLLRMCFHSHIFEFCYLQKWSVLVSLKRMVSHAIIRLHCATKPSHHTLNYIHEHTYVRLVSERAFKSFHTLEQTSSLVIPRRWAFFYLPLPITFFKRVLCKMRSKQYWLDYFCIPCMPCLACILPYLWLAHVGFAFAISLLTILLLFWRVVVVHNMNTCTYFEVHFHTYVYSTLWC